VALKATNGNKPWQLAIDFGTTSTVAATRDDTGQVELLQVEPDTYRMPSAVFRERSGRLVAGRRADKHAEDAPLNYNAMPKREMRWSTVRLGGETVPVTKTVGAVLARVLVEAFRQRGPYPPSAIVLTHPVRWGDDRLSRLMSALAEAAQMAATEFEAARMGEHRALVTKLPVATLVPEPAAAAQHYATAHRLAENETLAVYDLGGGTCDIAVLRRLEAASNPAGDFPFEVLADDGKDDVGGAEFDNTLFKYLGDKYLAGHPAIWDRLQHPGADAHWVDQQRRMLDNVREAKQYLSTSWQVACRLTTDPDVEILVQQSELWDLVKPALNDSVDILADVIATAGLRPDQLAGIYLVGGSARLPLVPKLIGERLGVEPTVLDDPKAVVARGALVRLPGATVPVPPPPPVLPPPTAEGPHQVPPPQWPPPAGWSAPVSPPVALGMSPTLVLSGWRPSRLAQTNQVYGKARGALTLRSGTDRVAVVNVAQAASGPFALPTRARIEGAALKKQKGYAELEVVSLSPSPYGHSCRQRTYKLGSSGETWAHRYVHIGVRDMVVVAPQRCLFVADQFRFDGPFDLKGLKDHFRVGVSCSPPPGWAPSWHMSLDLQGRRHLTAYEEPVDGDAAPWLDRWQSVLTGELKGPVLWSKPGTFLGNNPCRVIGIGPEKPDGACAVTYMGVVAGRGYVLVTERMAVAEAAKAVAVFTIG